jgi:prepilin-type N-terminal cleavage/methylation domain-containing protein
MRRSGSTLIELLVALAVLGVALAVSSVAFRAEAAPDAAERLELRIAEARRRAVESGRPVTVSLDSGRAGTAYPDGRVLTAEAFGSNPSGERPDAR